MGLFVAGEGRRFYGRTTTASMDAPHGHCRAAAGRRRRAPDLVQHAASERGLEGLPGDPVRQRVRCSSRPSTRRPPRIVFATAVLRGRAAGRRAQRRAGARAGGRRGARRAPGRRPRQLHGLGRDGPPGRTRRRRGGSRRSASSSAARTRSSSATTPTSTSAVRWALASAFSNAGQRCASASRIVVFDAVYEAFRDRLRRRRPRGYDAGPVISESERCSTRGSCAGDGARGGAPRPAGLLGRADGARGRRARRGRSPARSCSGRSRSSTAFAASTRRSRSSTTRRTG